MCFFIMSEQNDEIIDDTIEEEDESTEDNLDTDDLDGLKAKVTEQQGELDKLKNKDSNFAKVRTQVDEQKKVIEELKGKLEAKDTEVVSERIKDLEAKTAKDMSNGDEELEKKIVFHYNRLNIDKSDDSNIAAGYEDAKVLANKDAKGIDPIQQTASIKGSTAQDGTTESEDSLQMRRSMKISDKDKDKYGDDSWEPKYS